MAPYAALERMGIMRDLVSGRSRISVTELTRGKEWRRRLPESGVIEITDRGDTAGWLVSDDDMSAIIEGYAYLEEQLEQAQIAVMFSTRSDARPLSGEALAAAVGDAFDARKSALRGVLDGD